MSAESTVDVFVIPTGYMWLPDQWIFADGDKRLSHLSPDYSFLICHHSGKNVVFDLGMRKDFHNMPRVIRGDFASINPYVPKDAYDLLAEGPFKPDMIQTIILSHLHFDHTGDVSKFPNAQILVGPGSIAATSPGYPENETSSIDGTVFEHARLAEFTKNQFQKIANSWVPSHFPFDSAVDVFNDGSFLVFEAPGHMPGHQMALAHTGPQEWVAMGGDCCHHRGLLENLARDIGTKIGPGGKAGFHGDHEQARTTISKVRVLHRCPEVFVVLAHDAHIDGRIPLYPNPLNGWRAKHLKAHTISDPLTLDEVKARYQ